MQRLWAISWLTIKAAFRFRLVLLLSIVLLGGVVILPLIIKDDGTARGFTQILLTYTLTMITTLLGFATLWLACGTLARDLEECQIQMIAVKPIARWQIWLGKWFGILAVNAILLALSAGAVFLLLQWRAQRLPAVQQTILRNEILVARASAKPPIPNYEDRVRQYAEKKLKDNTLAPNAKEYVLKQIREQIKAEDQIVLPDYRKPWVLDLGVSRDRLQGRPLFLRFKFDSAQPTPSKTYRGFWVVGDFDSGRTYRTEEMSLASDTFHEIPIPSELIDPQGRITVNFVNRSESVLLFPLEDGLEVLYREGGFALNFSRAVAIIFFWLSFLAAVGLMASSFLSFPVATFFSIGLLIVGASTGTMSLILQQGTIFEVNHDTGMADAPAVLDHIALPIFRGLLNTINLIKGFSPIDSLSTGRSVSWSEVGLAFGQICVLFCGILALIGIAIFSRRELATAQTNQ
jgi:hypothetical protein